ncbi:DUF2970 domain-containing protein [Haliea sp. E1-2-M8]|uniref:DUF2970 domain-containing protein n=1 Tax=Haliea sp. E1-2-M8 TaxID=3064706 RepID=UPI00351C82AB
MSEHPETERAPPAEQEQNPESSQHRMRPWHVISSVFAAGLGVQSSRNRERDFKQGKAGVFIAAGLIFTLLFIAAVVLIVQVVLKSAS